MTPRVSVLLPTRDRPDLLATALRCYAEQDYADRELLVLDDGAEYPVDEAAVAAVGGRLLRFDHSMLLGAKLNVGAEAARGDLLLKWDDDDYLAPGFISAHVAPFLAHPDRAAAPLVVACNRYRVLFVRTWDLWRRRPDTLCGLFCVPRALWAQCPFPEIAGQGSDTRFLAALDERGVTRRPIDGDRLLVVIRRDGIDDAPAHTYRERDGQTFEKRFRSFNHRETGLRPEDVLPAWALAPLLPLRERADAAAANALARGPLVTVLVPTRDRPALLATTLRCYAEQTYPNRELLVLDDSVGPVDEAAIAAVGGRLLRFPPGIRLGDKLNVGAAEARGEILVKMDDDDYFAPAFIAAHVHELWDPQQPDTPVNARVVAGCFRFPVIILRDWQVVDRRTTAITGNFAVPAALWRTLPFPTVDGNGTDSSFLEVARKRGVRLARIDGRDLMVVTRRDSLPGVEGHTFHTFREQGVADYFQANFPPDPRIPTELLPDWALAPLRAIAPLSAGTQP
jgi:glycosyltransferase involved in cell wall biosynthesis